MTVRSLAIAALLAATATVAFRPSGNIDEVPFERNAEAYGGHMLVLPRDNSIDPIARQNAIEMARSGCLHGDHDSQDYSTAFRSLISE